MWQAHKLHYYQRLNQLGAGHRGTLAVYATLAALFVAVVCIALVSNGVFDVFFYYQEHKASLIRIQREQAEAAAATLPARLRGHVLRSYRPGRRRLRLRFPRQRGADSRAGNSLDFALPDTAPAEDP